MFFIHVPRLRVPVYSNTCSQPRALVFISLHPVIFMKTQFFTRFFFFFFTRAAQKFLPREFQYVHETILISLLSNTYKIIFEIPKVMWYLKNEFCVHTSIFVYAQYFVWDYEKQLTYTNAENIKINVKNWGWLYN